MTSEEYKKASRRISKVDHELCWVASNAHSVLFRRKKTVHELELVRDKDCKMAAVFLDGDCLHCGNYWDFHPGCHGGMLRILGYLYGKWGSAEQLCDLVCRVADGGLARESYSVRYFASDGTWRGDGWARKRANKTLVKTV